MKKWLTWLGTPRDETWMVMVAGVFTIAFLLGELVRRLIEVVPNREVFVTVVPDDMTVDLPIGPQGGLVQAGLEGISVSVSDMSPVIYLSVLGAATVIPVMWIVIAVLLMGVCHSLARGDVFVRANTLRVHGISMTLLAGAVLQSTFETFQNNGVLAVVGGGPDGPVRGDGLHLEPGLWFAAMAVSAVAVAFRRGEKLQRDTEGLV